MVNRSEKRGLATFRELLLDLAGFEEKYRITEFVMHGVD